MKSVAIIFITLCVIHFQNAHANVKVLRRYHADNSKRLIFHALTYVDRHLTYAFCDNTRNNEVKCNVIREKQPYGDESYSCQVILKRTEYHENREPDITVTPFGKNYAAVNLIESIESQNLTFTTVQFDNCKVSETVIDTKSWFFGGAFSFAIVGHSDSYDVFYKSSISCADKWCKVIIGAGGQIVGGPVPSIGNMAKNTRQPIVSLDEYSSSKGYFYLKDDGKDYIDTFIKPDGSEISLSKHAKTFHWIAMSRSNNLIGICMQTNSEYLCKQYDFDGKSKLQMTIPKHNNRLELVDMFNLPNGGFYLLSRECIEYTGLCRPKISRHLIERIDAQGIKTGYLAIQSTQEDKPIAPLFYENEAKETCVSLVAYDNPDSPKSKPSYLYPTANCFTDADFTVYNCILNNNCRSDLINKT